MFNDGEYWGALNAYREAANHFDILAEYFIDGYDKHNYTKSKDELEKMITTLELPCLLQLAATEIMFEKYEEALDSCMIVCGYDFNDVRANYHAAVCHYALKQYRTAMIHLDNALERDLENKAVLDLMLKIEKSMNDCKDTILECNQIIKSHKVNFEAFFNRGKAYIHLQENLDLAISDLEHAQKLSQTKDNEIKPLILKALELKKEATDADMDLNVDTPKPVATENVKKAHYVDVDNLPRIPGETDLFYKLRQDFYRHWNEKLNQ
jgi:tetratricopeptide (TPR) repeat protein